MLTNFELNQISARSDNPDVALLVQELKEMQQYILDYNKQIERKLDSLESDMLALEAENKRLLMVKEGLGVERDACVGLISRLARHLGMNAGVAAENQIIVDLPSGQVSWQFGKDESYLFDGLPAYEGSIEELPIEENYRRVMNPGIA